jgi:hypothetical protein
MLARISSASLVQRSRTQIARFGVLSNCHLDPVRCDDAPCARDEVAPGGRDLLPPSGAAWPASPVPCGRPPPAGQAAVLTARRRDSPAHLRALQLLPDLTRCRPSPCDRLSRPRSTTAAPPRPRLRLASRLSVLAFLAGRRRRNGNGRFPCSLSSGQRVRHPALPLRHRHGYAAGNSPWPPIPGF